MAPRSRVRASESKPHRPPGWVRTSLFLPEGPQIPNVLPDLIQVRISCHTYHTCCCMLPHFAVKVGHVLLMRAPFCRKSHASCRISPHFPPRLKTMNKATTHLTPLIHTTTTTTTTATTTTTTTNDDNNNDNNNNYNINDNNHTHKHISTQIHTYIHKYINT